MAISAMHSAPDDPDVGRAEAVRPVCKQPGCANPVPEVPGRGRPRVFCSDTCARRYHNGARVTAATADESDAGGDPLAELDALMRQAAVAVRAARKEAAELDPASVRAHLADADAARRRAEASVVTATARQAEAEADAQALSEALEAARVAAESAEARALKAAESVDEVRAELARVRGEIAAEVGDVRAMAMKEVECAQAEEARAKAERDGAVATARDVRAAADAETGRARQAEADARAEADRIRADMAREREMLVEHSKTQLEVARALADAERARAERAEAQLEAERADRQQLTACLAENWHAFGGEPQAAGRAKKGQL